MKRKLSLLLLSILVLHSSFILLNGCGHRCDQQCYYHTSAQLVVMDNSDSLPKQVSSGRVLAAALMFTINVQDTLGVCGKRNFSLINTASAECSGHRIANSFDTFYLTSDHAFNASHPAGAVLNDLFIQSGSLIRGVSLYLRVKPDDTGTHIFTVKLVPKDTSKAIIAHSLPVKLLL
jgi:hypothetical protein